MPAFLLPRCTALAGLMALSLSAADTRLVRETEALTPDQERAALHVPEGFEIQLFASEPMINKPINMAFDAKGRLWVSSTVEYPYCADKSRWSDAQGTRVKDSRDAIKILEDTDGDGRADKVTDFADGLNIPTGVVPWHKPEHKDGCIAWSIPNIWYFADTDGDGKADLREVLFGPLGYEKDTHGMCSSFRLGLDGWIYATHGFNNTSHFKVRAKTTENTKHTKNQNSVSSEPPVVGKELDLHSGNVFRFRPDGSRVEPWTHGQVNPFGLCWDRYGNLYIADCHSAPIYQLIRGAHYPSFAKPHDGLGFAPVMCEHTHGSTGICGIAYIDGGVWGPEWDDHMFVGNVVTSKVNHDHVTFTGSTPKANEKPDFITSDDPWFRPVDLQLGPDNALYIADFYNRIIGHYEVPLDHPGRDRERGRILRVVKKGPLEEDRKGNPLMADFHKAVEALKSPNGILRGLAVNEIVSKYNGEVERSYLRSLLVEKQPSETVRLGAFAALCQIHNSEKDYIFGCTELEHVWSNRLGGEYNNDVHVALAMAWPSGSSRERLSAVQASIYRPGTEEILLMACMMDTESKSDPVLGHSLAIALKHALALPGAHEAYEEAKWEESVPHADRAIAHVSKTVHTRGSALWLQKFLGSKGSDYLWDDRSELEKVIHSMVQSLEPSEVEGLIAALRKRFPTEPALQSSLIQAMYDGLRERGRPANASLLTWAQELAVQLLHEVAQQPAASWESIPQTAPEPAWSLVKRKCSDGTEAMVLQSMKKGGDEEIRTGILRSKAFTLPPKLSFWINGHCGPPNLPANDKNLVRLLDAQTGAPLAGAWPPRRDSCEFVEWDLSEHAGKQVRLEIVDGDQGRAYAWVGLTRIEPPVVSVEDFEKDDRARNALRSLAVLLQHSAPAALREKLAAYLPTRPAPPPLPVSPEQRQQLDALIVARSKAFARVKPDLVQGEKVFTANCSACHQIGGKGGLIGPQLDGIGNRGVARLCEDILDPNRNVDAHFHLHTLTLKDGSSMSGFLKAEVGQVLILADAAGQEHRVAKTDLAKDDVMPMSLMPPVFGQTVSEKDFLNLIGWLLGK